MTPTVELPTTGEIIHLDYPCVEEMLVDVKEGLDNNEIEANGGILLLTNYGTVSVQFRTENMSPAEAIGYLECAKQALIEEMNGGA